MMPRYFLAASLFILLSTGGGAYGQTGSGSPFIGLSDTGETVRILPPPASIRPPHDTQPIDAPVSQGTAVYPASYGSGNLINHGGPEITDTDSDADPGFLAIYWNSNVANSSATSLGYSTIQSQIDAFITKFSDNSNWDNSSTDDYEIIQQYGTPATSILDAFADGGSFVDSQATKSSISDSQLQSYLSSLFTAGKVSPSNDVVYGIYLPSGMTVKLGFFNRSCVSFCAYHGHYSYNGTQIKYAVFPYLSCTACSLSGKSVADMLTITTSHEIRESVTDPLLNAWYDSQGYEADDKCAWHNLYEMTNGDFWVQPEYSNGGTVTADGFTANYPGPGCVVP